MGHAKRILEEQEEKEWKEAMSEKQCLRCDEPIHKILVEEGGKFCEYCQHVLDKDD